MCDGEVATIPLEYIVSVMRISVGQLRQIIREELERGHGSTYLSSYFDSDDDIVVKPAQFGDQTRYKAYMHGRVVCIRDTPDAARAAAIHYLNTGESLT